MQDDHDPPLPSDDAWQEPSETDLDIPTPLEAERLVHQIDFDLNCIRCGYNLRSASAEGQCPECGEPVESTLTPDPLHLADPAWLGKLRKGTNWLIASIFMSLAMIPIAVILTFATLASQNSATSATPMAMPLTIVAVMGVLGLITSLAYTIAIWLMSEREPDRDDTEDHLSRPLMRWLTIPAMFISLSTGLLNMSSQISVLYLAAGIEFVTGATVLAGFLAGMWYLRTLAQRIPEHSLAKQTYTVFWGYLVTMSIAILFSSIMSLIELAGATSGSTTASVGVGVLGLAMCPVGLGLLVFVIWGIVLVFRYRTRFTQAHEIAIGHQHANA